MRRLCGFTLIELLVVVAIIGILATIALPNYQHAQVRAKTSAALAEMQTLSTAIEQYYMDYNTYPLDGNDYGERAEEYFDQRRIQHILTTPTAYISEIPGDLFHDKSVSHDDPLVARHFVSKFPYPYVYFSQGNYAVNKGTAKAYFIFSLGPNRLFDNADSREGDYKIYDVSNGIVSEGDLLRKGP
ncbi:MAG: prepilin-type N-terminal cleavage/methylation domain-containing protein [Candidatus Omnitrophota bacterium]